MDTVTLYDMIKYFEYGTKLHIGVLFFENYGNQKCDLPSAQYIHSSPLCNILKTHNKTAFKKCFACRNLAIKKALSSKTPFYGLCINGIFEYTHPVVIDGNVACIIFIGNILDEEKGLQKIHKRFKDTNLPINTLEENFTIEDCKKISLLLENFIIYLLNTFPSENEIESSLIKNIKNYINSNFEFDINIKVIADIFHYNQKYLGRLFKKGTGISISEYINYIRINEARRLLLTPELKIIHIANKIGYNNVTYFNKQFKDLVGTTPLNYRKKHLHS